MIENGNMNKEKWKLDSVKNRSNEQINRRNTEHRLSALSLGYIPTEHPTSYELQRDYLYKYNRLIRIFDFFSDI